MPTATDITFLEQLREKQRLAQSESRLIDDIISYYIRKKKISNSKFVFRATEKTTNQFKEAASICIDYNLDPGVFVDLAYKRFPNSAIFFPSHLTGKGLRQYIRDHVSASGTASTDTIFSITPEETYQHQKGLLDSFIARGFSIDEVLSEPGLKFSAWFRILMTPERNQKIIDVYRRIARMELTPQLEELIKSKNLDIKRIIGL